MNEETLRTEVRQATRVRFSQTMGELRSMASAAGRQKGVDEEAYFQGLVAEYFLVIRQEMAKLVGYETAIKLIEFDGKPRES